MNYKLPPMGPLTKCKGEIRDRNFVKPCSQRDTCQRYLFGDPKAYWQICVGFVPDTEGKCKAYLSMKNLEEDENLRRGRQKRDV